MAQTLDLHKFFNNISLVDNSGKTFTTDHLRGKIVGLYFSAHWCPPCRGFTPKLAQFYTQFKAKRADFEVVFVSSDKDKTQFEEYFHDMPWLALPYEHRDVKSDLASCFKVSGIPSFQLVDWDKDTLITKEGRTGVMEDEKGDNFPWYPKSFSEILGTTLVNNKGEQVKVESLKGKKIGVYFSAHWCPPCRGFTPTLIEVYNLLKTQKPGQFEVIFVSSDRDETQFKEYFGEMPWLAIPFDEEKRRDELSTHFEVEGIPQFTMIESDGSILNQNARMSVASDKNGKSFPWIPKTVKELSRDSSGIAQSPSFLLYFNDKWTEENKKEKKAKYGQLLKEYKDFAEQEMKKADYIAFVSRFDAQIRDRISSLCGLEGKTQEVLLLVIYGNGFALYDQTQVTAASIREFVGQYKAKKVTITPLQ